MLRTFVRFLQRILSPRLYRKLRHPVILPIYYRTLLEDVEDILDLEENYMDKEYWGAILRKHAHILDKGLWAQTFEIGHGREYRFLAQRALDVFNSKSIEDDPSLNWALSIISKYDSSQISGFGLLRKDLKKDMLSNQSNIDLSYEKIMRLIKVRRSIRILRRDSVDSEILKMVLEAGIWAPSSCNKQTLKIFATNNPNLASKCLKTCKGGTCFSDFIPCFISFCADLRSYCMPEESWLAQIDTSMAAQNSCLVATSLGLSITPLSWCQHDDEEEKELRELLDIPFYCRIIVNGVMGYPAVMTGAPERKLRESFIKIYE